jgi:cellobiose phosphorylase
MAAAMNVNNPLEPAFTFSDGGALRSIEVGAIRVSLASPSGSSRALANLYLRRRGLEPAYIPILGAESPSRFCAKDGIFAARGSWAGLDYECVLQTARAQPSWRWQLRVQSRLDHAVELDLIYVQDIGLKASGPGLVNEYYASQYLERRVFEDPSHGCVVCCRQNMKELSGHPWVMIACANRAVAASTDGSQLYGELFRATGEIDALRADELGGELSGESSVVALQEEAFSLAPGASHTSAFVATYLPDHPEASSVADTHRLPDLMRSFPDVPPLPATAFSAPAAQRFERVKPMPTEDLHPGELVELFGGALRHTETADGELLSFFVDGPRHVVSSAKELRVKRPHGHIMQANARWMPDESVMSTTAFACGVFNSHLTQGNTNFNTLLSVCTNPVTPSLASGQRIIVQLDDGEYLLGVPSAFEMGLNHCRWIYKRGSTCLQVRTWTAPGAPRINLDFQVMQGAPVRLWLTHDFDDLNGWTLLPGAAHEFIARPRADSPLAERFSRPQFRIIVNSQEVPYSAAGAAGLGLDAEPSERSRFVLDVPEASAFCMSFVGEVTGPVSVGRIHDADAEQRSDGAAALSASRELGRELALNGPDAIAAIREILPWYGMNALIHFLTPYGLEQFSGAAWGTRDVCQGPIDLLLCQEQYEPARQVLRMVFSNQEPGGGWPQWWMFDRYQSVRADSAHGDVIYWCILALCSYIKASGDFSILQEPLPYFQPDDCRPDEASPATPTPLFEHVARTIALVVGSFVPGTALVQFGGGDWNDSLQPVSKDLARRLISSWTVQMSYQAISEYSDICTRAGYGRTAEQLQHIARRILADFNRHLVKDGVVAGYGLVADQTIDVLLHPSDTKTGVRYSLLPMNRGVISGVFTKEQAEHHSGLIERHLKGPDGARLMDRPLRYEGGPQTTFQRAESSTYFGREIGLMYVHEHLRYAESQARLGKGDALLQALRQAIPVGYQEVVPQGTIRQANCYYSSSDVLFKSRYAADEHYDEVVGGTRPLDGGWRVYSSGPGIYVALVLSRLLGLRIEFGRLIIDPVLARSLDGLEAALRFRGCRVVFAYHVEGPGFGPRAISVNGKAVSFDYEDNAYRAGGAVFSLEPFMALLEADDNRVEIWV